MKVKKVAESLEASSSSFNNSEFYLLEYKGDISTIKFGGDEKNKIVLLSEEEVDNKILEGKIHDNFTLAAWGYYKAKASKERNEKKTILNLIKKFFHNKLSLVNKYKTPFEIRVVSGMQTEES